MIVDAALTQLYHAIVGDDPAFPAKGCGPVAHDDAQEIARIVLIGVRRPQLVLDESTVDGWWQFRARAPDSESLDCVYTHMATGNLYWARRVLSISELQLYEIATMRTTALGECFGGPTSVKDDGAES